MDRTTKQVNKKTEYLNNTINQLDLIDILRKIHRITAIHILLPSAHGTISSIDHMSGHKISLNMF